MLLHHFEHSIVSICKNLGFDRALYATAVVFFKRFYLYAAQIEYPPWKLVYVCHSVHSVEIRSASLIMNRGIAP